MSFQAHSFSRCMAIVLSGALIVASAPVASAKPLTPEKAHQRILKQGMGNWAGVELADGTAFAGRIINIGDDSFSLQLHNDPAITPVRYRDVVGLQTGVSHGAFTGLLIAGIAGVAVAAGVGFYEVHKHSQMPALPNQPTQPVFP